MFVVHVALDTVQSERKKFPIFFSISNWFTYFYIQQDNNKKLTKKTYKNKQQHKNKTLVRFENDKD